MAADLVELKTRLESWTNLVPANATAFHGERIKLIERIRALSGFFNRKDPREVSAIVNRAGELEATLPTLQSLFASIKEVQTSLEELTNLVSADVDKRVRASVLDLTSYQNAILTAIAADVSTNQVQAVVDQVKAIKRWCGEQRRALLLIVGITALRDYAPDSRQRSELTAVVGGWTDTFLQNRADSAWADYAEGVIEKYRQAALAQVDTPAVRPIVPEAPPKLEPKPQPKAEPPVLPPSSPVTKPLQNSGIPLVATVPLPEPPPRHAPPTKPVEPAPAAPAADNLFFEIRRLLAECRDMAEALNWSPAEFDRFNQAERQLRGATDIGRPAVESLLREVQAFQKQLQEKAAEERDRRIKRLRRHWSWLNHLYGARDDIYTLVQQADAASTAAATSLREVFELVDTAEQRIYAVSNNDRRKLAVFVNGTIDACQNVVAQLKQQCRTRAVNATLQTLTDKLPAATDHLVDARQSFERLENCDDFRQEIGRLGEENGREQAAVLAQVTAVRQLAGELAPDDEEAPQLLASIATLTPDRFLEEFSADIDRIAQRLAAKRTQIRDRKIADLKILREESRNWIALLADFGPEAESLASNEPPPEQLGALRDLVAVEGRNRDRLMDLVISATAELKAQLQKGVARLEELLQEPAFESHPDYSTAAELLDRLKLLPPLASPPDRDSFEEALLAKRDFEAFMDRIEHVRRAVPERLKGLQESFRALRKWNGHVYRPHMSQRLGLLIQGIQHAIDMKEWDRVGHQLDETARLLAAVTKDARRRISVETEDAAAALEEMLATTKDEQFGRQIRMALDQLKQWGHLEPPPFDLRRRMNLLLGRRTVVR